MVTCGVLLVRQFRSLVIYAAMLFCWFVFVARVVLFIVLFCFVYYVVLLFFVNSCFVLHALLCVCVVA